MNNLAIFAPVVGAFGLLVAFLIYQSIRKMDPGTDLMRELGDRIHEGAMVFLRREYSILFVFIAIVFVLLFAFMEYKATSVAFLSGAICSMLCGVFGMQAATIANVRTSQAANKFGQGQALQAAFNGGAVMGLSVASLGMIGFGTLFILYKSDIIMAESISGFAMGASQ